LIGGVDRHVPGEPEIEHLHQAVRRDDNVRGFQIVVDNAPAVGVAERAGDLHAVAQNGLDGEAGLPNQCAQGPALHQLHRNVQLVVYVEDLVDRADVGMVEGGTGPCFVKKMVLAHPLHHRTV
jgi:hypothetical protein